MAKITKARGCAGLKSATFKAKCFAGRPLAPAALPKPHGDLPTRCKVRFSGFVGGEEILWEGGRGGGEPFLRIYTISKDMGTEIAAPLSNFTGMSARHVRVGVGLPQQRVTVSQDRPVVVHLDVGVPPHPGA